MAPTCIHWGAAESRLPGTGGYESRLCQQIPRRAPTPLGPRCRSKLSFIGLTALAPSTESKSGSRARPSEQTSTGRGMIRANLA